MNPIIISLLIAVVIVLASIVYFIISVIKTLKDSQGILNQVGETMNGFEKQTEGITSEIDLLTQKADVLTEDFSNKSAYLDSLFFGLDSFKDTVQQFIQTFKDLSSQMTMFSNQDLVETIAAVQWASNLFSPLKKTK